MNGFFRSLGLGLLLWAVSSSVLTAQSNVSTDLTLDQLPGYERFQKINQSRRALMGLPRLTRFRWSADGSKFSYRVNDETKMFTIANKEIGDAEPFEEYERPKQERPKIKSRVGRALQRTVETSPNEKWKAVYRDFNVWIEPDGDDAAEPIQVTKGGNARHRYGTCCWVYGEELDQNEAMWWSPDSRYLVYYEVDEKGMRDYVLTTDNTKLYTDTLSVRYPKAGDRNPQVNLWVYDRETGKSKILEIPGPATQYLFNIRFPTKSNMLVVSRTNRQQNVLDVFGIDVSNGNTRKIVTETQETWQENAPAMRFLDDQERFIWETERNGFRHYELRHINGKRLNPLSEVGDYPCSSILKVDEKTGYVYFTAFSDKNPYNKQLHRVKLDGTEHMRITTSPLNHTTFTISPLDNVVVAGREQLDTPPEMVVYDASNGKELAVLMSADTRRSEQLGLRKPELFSFTADDGETEIYGTLHFPSNFDPGKKYPLLIDVYGGPGSRGLVNRYRPANSFCEFGYLIAKIGNRGTIGRGKAFESATYKNLGIRDLDDQAAGVKHLAKRSYVDGKRVGIYGHSYGGYMSALAVLKYPDVFHVAVAGAPVTDWKNYDSIYTERYMQTPQQNREGYRNGSCMKYAKQLRGRLLLVHGLIDDNVHPSNTWQLIKKLQDEDKRFDLMIYPGFKHGIGSTYMDIRWEYFFRHLRPSVN